MIRVPNWFIIEEGCFNKGLGRARLVASWGKPELSERGLNED
jgi:hypothetical protein